MQGDEATSNLYIYLQGTSGEQAGGRPRPLHSSGACDSVLSSEALEAGTGPTAAGLSQRGPQASSGWSPRRLPPPPGLGWASSRSLGVPVCWWSAGKVGGSRPDGVCSALSAGCREAGGARGASLTKPALSAGSWASGTDVVAFLPHQEPLIHTRRGLPHGDPTLPFQRRASSGQGARRGHAGVTRPAVPEVGPGREQQAHGIRAVAEGPEPAGAASAGWTQATPEAALIGEAVAVWGRGEPRAAQPGAALSWPGHPGVWPSALAFWAVRPQPRPPGSCIQASAASGAQTPSAISAPELLIFLKRLAALTAMKFFWGRVETGLSQHRGS